MRAQVFFLSLIVGILLVPFGAFAEHATEQKRESNPAAGVANDLSLEEAAKIYFATMLVTVEHPQVEKKLAEELSKKLADSDSKIVGSIDPNAIKSSSVPAALLSSFFFASAMEPRQMGGKFNGSASLGLGILASASSICTSSFLPGKLADYKNRLLKKNGEDFDKSIERESLTKAVQEEVNVRSGLLGKMLKWSPEQEQKFVNAYRNAIYVSFGTEPGVIAKHTYYKQPPGLNTDWSFQSGSVGGSSELPGVLDVIERNRLASDVEINALRRVKAAEEEVRSLCEKSDSVASSFDRAILNTMTHNERNYLSNQNSYFQGRIEFINTVLEALKEVRKDPELGNEKAVLLKIAKIKKDGQNAFYMIRRVKELSDYLVPH